MLHAHAPTLLSRIAYSRQDSELSGAPPETAKESPARQRWHHSTEKRGDEKSSGGTQARPNVRGTEERSAQKSAPSA